MENEPKYVFLLTLYFLFLIGIVTMFSSIALDFGLDETYTTSNGLDTRVGYADGPRFDGQRFLNREANDNLPAPLMYYGYIRDNESCESYQGFSWEPFAEFDGWWFIPSFNIGSVTCRGLLDIDYYSTPDDNFTNANFGGPYANDDVCHLGLLDENQTIAESLGCTWYDRTHFQNNVFDDTDISGFWSVWDSLKTIVTFDINFGVEDDFLNFIINFLLVGLPGIILITYIIIIGRKIVGFT